MRLRPEAQALLPLAAAVAGMASPLWAAYVRRDAWPAAREALLRAEAGFAAWWLDGNVCVLADARVVGLPGQEGGPPELVVCNEKAGGAMLGCAQAGAEFDLSPRFALLKASGEAVGVRPGDAARLAEGADGAFRELQAFVQSQQGGG